MNLPHNLNNQENNKQIEAMFFEIMKRFDNGNKLVLLDPKEDMEIENKELDKLIKANEQID